MQKKIRKISYIKKPFARKSFISLFFGFVAFVCCMVSLGISISMQGNGDVRVAAWGLSSIIFSAVSLVYSFSSFLEKEMNYILAKISLLVSAVLLVFWISAVVVGFLAL